MILCSVHATDIPSGYADNNTDNKNAAYYPWYNRGIMRVMIHLKYFPFLTFLHTDILQLSNQDIHASLCNIDQSRIVDRTLRQNKDTTLVVQNLCFKFIEALF